MYRFKPGEQTIYKWQLHATSKLSAGNYLRQRDVKATGKVTESVRSIIAGAAKLELRVQMQSVRVDGISVPNPEPTLLELFVLPSGKVQSARTLSEGILTVTDLEGLVVEYRPELPMWPVEIGDSWQEGVRVTTKDTSLDLHGHSKLTGFDLVGVRPLAAINGFRSGRVSTTVAGEGVSVSERGTARISTEARIDIRKGILRSSLEVYTATFKVTNKTTEGSLSIESTSSLRAP